MKEAVELLIESPWFYLLGLVLGSTYFYFRKKFENLADKEDISSLTRDVENVKKEFNEDLERLKSNLDVIKSDKITLVNDRRKSIYNFWFSINHWGLKYDSMFNLTFLNMDDYEKFKVELDVLESKFTFERSVLELLLLELADKDFIDLTHKVFVSLINIKYDALEHVLNLIDYHNEKNKEINNLFDLKREYENNSLTLKKEYLKNRMLLKLKLTEMLNKLV